MFRPAILGALVLLLVAAFVHAQATTTATAPAIVPGPKTLRVYHIGNSVTDTIRYSALKQLAASRGRTYSFGRHMIPGSPLSWIWQHPDSGFKEDPYGYYPTALANYQWNAITLQPFDRLLTGPEGDEVMIKNFLNLAFKKSPDATIYIYQRWPRREEVKPAATAPPSATTKAIVPVYKPLDYQAKWSRKYTGGWDGTDETRDYFNQVLATTRKDFPGKTILLVPVGDSLAALDQELRAGRVPGYADVSALYADGIHFKNAGAYLVGITFYATLFHDTPIGLATAPYEDPKDPSTKIDAKLAALMQECVWKTVTSNPDTGVVK